MYCTYGEYMQTKPSNDSPRVIVPSDLIGSVEAAALLGITKPSLTRRIAAGTLEPLTRLDSGRGAFVFDRNDLPSVRK